MIAPILHIAQNKLVLSVLSIAFLLSCTKSNEDAVVSDKRQEVAQHWTYEGETGPEHWKEIEKQSDCDGTRQSPINIIDIDVVSDDQLVPIDVHYSSKIKIHDITNNGHTLQYNFEKGDYITLNDEKFELRQIHFHEAAEHTINGIRYPLEIHLVHLNKNKEVAVLAIMVMEGESSEPFDFLEKYLPVQNGETKLINANFDLNLSLPKEKDYYTYEGSLTTPPCTQNVTWFVYKNPITISVDQVKMLQKLMPLNNYRGEQAINDRVVRQYLRSN